MLIVSLLNAVALSEMGMVMGLMVMGGLMVVMMIVIATGRRRLDFPLILQQKKVVWFDFCFVSNGLSRL